MEQNVNKAASWEDVLSDNYNAEPQAEQVQETVQPTGEETPQAVDAAGEPIETPQVNEEVPVTEQEEAVSSPEETPVQEEVQQTPTEQQFNLEGLDEDALYEYLSLKKTDYSTVPDIDVVAGFISSEPSSLSP